MRITADPKKYIYEVSGRRSASEGFTINAMAYSDTKGLVDLTAEERIWKKGSSAV